jgi:hypothetical protein
MDFKFSLLVDPTLRIDASSDVILDGQSGTDNFGFSVALAGDFNEDRIDDIIVGTNGDGNNSVSRSGSAFVFLSSSVFPSITFSDTTSSKRKYNPSNDYKRKGCWPQKPLVLIEQSLLTIKVRVNTLE